MTVALSILFAAVVGGVVFALIDARFERGARPAVAAAEAPTTWLPPLPPSAPRRDPNPPPVPERLWSGWTGP